jgi:S-adenosyl-L-methionine hydrolase (adenosine-forming)
MTIITLLSDFGTADGYVGEMKGVLATSAPSAVLVDISHDVMAHDVEAGRLAVARYWHRYPVGTVHLAVVDPGVGGPRAAIAVESEGRYLVGPDNGLLSPALLRPGARCISLAVPPSASATFHGRDVFAPAAARLASAQSVESLGEIYTDPVILRTAEAKRRDDGAVVGSVITIDRFGNLVTNLVVRRGGEVEIGGRRLAIRRTYADVEAGGLVALVGSSGLLEIAVRNGSAADTLGARRGMPVALINAPA